MIPSSGTIGLDPLIDVTGVRVLARYIVELTFADGAVRVMDLEPYLWGPVFEPLTSNYDLFCQVAIDPVSGTICWPNGADFAPESLYVDSKPVVPS